jgi:predicted phosphodiesterase
MCIFDLWSDFHIEGNRRFDWNNWQPTSNILVLAGDTSNQPAVTLQVVKEAADVYEHVLFVSGNHDYYGNHSIYETNKIFREKLPDRVNFLEAGIDKWVSIEDTLFVGDMGWYSWDYPGVGLQGKQADNWYHNLNDARYIEFKGYLPPDLAQDSAEYLYDELSSNFRKTFMNTVVVTHTVPHLKGLVGPDHMWAPLNGSYYNSYMGKIWNDDNIKPDVWCFGHTHQQNDFLDNGVRFISNPRGYHGERDIAKLPKLIEL